MDAIDLALLVQVVQQLNEHDTRDFLQQLGHAYHATGRLEAALDCYLFAARLSFEHGR